MPYKSTRKRKVPCVKIIYYVDGKKQVEEAQYPMFQPVASTSAESEVPLGSTAAESEIMETMDTDTEDHVTSQTDIHHERKGKTTAAWDLHFTSLMNAATEIEFPSTFTCMGCGKEEQAILMCRDCFPHTFMCSGCFATHHQYNLLHKPLQWNDEDHTFKPVFYEEEPVVSRMDHGDCSTAYLRSIVVINNEGFQSRIRFKFCKCEPEVATLIRHSFWSSTPSNPAVAIHFGVMEFLRLLVVECQLSIHSFFEALRWRNIDKIQNVMIIKELYRCISGECFEMYRRYVYTKSHLHHLCPEFDDGTKCPACPTDQDETTIFSLDANFGLVRRKAAGTSVKEPFHSGHFFLDQVKVDEFVENYQAKNTDKGCSEFQAGSDLRSKNKNRKLEETGVFGACCRHEHPKVFFNLKHGERLANAVYLVKHLQATNNNMIILYDIACKLTSHLQKNSDRSILQDVTFGIPVFHCFGHQISCQVLYSPRRIEGAGLTDGETMERLWAFLRRFKKITKEMQSDHRIDLLVDGLMHFSEKLRRKMVPFLCQKLIKAVEAEKVLAEELANVAPNLDYNEIEDMKKMEEQLMAKKKPQHTRDDKWKEEYALKVFEHINLRQEEGKLGDGDEAKREHILAEATRIEKSMGVLERRQKIRRWTVDSEEYNTYLPMAVATTKEEKTSQLQTLAYEHMCLKEAVKKYADGQTVATRLCNQLKKLNKRIGDSVTSYNSLPKVETPYPITINDSDVKSLDSHLWIAIKQISSPTSTSKIHRQAVDLYCRLCRSREEQTLVKVEMKRVIQHHVSSLMFLENFQVRSLLGPTSQHLLGAQALIKQHIYTRIGVLRDIFKAVGSIIDISSAEEQVNALSVSNDHPILFCEDSDSESDNGEEEC